MTKNNFAADNFIPIMKLGAANGCSYFCLSQDSTQAINVYI